MSDLVEFLLARIAEDEAAARAVKPLGVTVDMGGNRHPDVLGHVRYVTEGIEGRVRGEVDQEAGEHFARWDPARVLAECEAKRRIVELHKEWPVLIQTEPSVEAAPDLGNFAYRASQEIVWATNREYVARFGTEAPTSGVLALLALPYADHPDYREEWRP